MRRVLPLALAALCLVPGPARAQGERFEIGQRLRAFEAAWERHPDEAARKRALERLPPVTALFFQNKVQEIARILDEARHALASEKAPPPEVRWADTLSVQPVTRFADANLRELKVSLRAFYQVKPTAPQGSTLRLTLVKADGKTTLAAQETVIKELPLEVALPVEAGEGDCTLVAQVRAGGKVLAEAPGQTISLVADLTGRLAALKKAVEALPGNPGIERRTLADRVALLEALAAGASMEMNYPAARLLAEAEAVRQAAQEGKRYFGEKKSGSFWLRLPVGSKGVAVRLLAPESVREGKPLPLVIALHGAGGSENLFFEGYGSGEVVRQCRRRGWLLVAPRTEGFSLTAATAELIDEVARLYPVDRKRVFLVGHSMGAMQAVTAAADAPDRFAAVAALAGGGGFLKKSEGMKALPIFVGVGSKDFMAGMARNLKDGLRQAGVAGVEFREYPDVEHLVIVRVALPEVFAFFDKAARR
jgi:poly(3-hydroxybutyrate) depolymerase